MRLSRLFRAALLGVAGALSLSLAATAAEVRVLISGGLAAACATVSKEPDAGRALIKFLASPGARDAIVKSGMDPITTSATN